MDFLLSDDNIKTLNNIENYINREELEDENYCSVDNVNTMYKINEKLKKFYDETTNYDEIANFNELKNIKIPNNNSLTQN